MRTGLVLMLLLMAFSVEAQIENLRCRAFSNALDTCVERNILDAAPAGYKREFGLAGALAIPDKNSFLEQAERLDKETPLFVYCPGGTRSVAVCKLAQEMGFKHIFNLVDGMERYEQKGYPVEYLKK